MTEYSLLLTQSHRHTTCSPVLRTSHRGRNGPLSVNWDPFLNQEGPRVKDVECLVSTRLGSRETSKKVKILGYKVKEQRLVVSVLFVSVSVVPRVTVVTLTKIWNNSWFSRSRPVVTSRYGRPLVLKVPVPWTMNKQCVNYCAVCDKIHEPSVIVSLRGSPGVHRTIPYRPALNWGPSDPGVRREVSTSAIGIDPLVQKYGCPSRSLFPPTVPRLP